MNRILLAYVFFALLACTPNDPQTPLEKGKAAIAAQQWSIAIIQLKNAIRQAPEMGEARFLLGMAYLHNDQIPFARKELERAQSLGVHSAEVVPLLSEVYRRQGDTKALENLTASANDLNPNDWLKLTFHQATSLIESGQHEKATQLLNQAKQHKFEGPFSLLIRALELRIGNELNAAISQVQLVLNEHRSHPEALLLMGRLQLAYKKPVTAARFFQQYIDAYPKEDNTKLELARLYVDIGQTAKAESLVDGLLASYPTVPILLQLKGAARLNQSDAPAALDFAEQALAINAEDSGARLLAGVSAYYISDKEKAHHHLSLVVDLLPEQHPALRILADCQISLGLYTEASQTAQAFKNLTEEDIVLVAKIGQELSRAGYVKHASQLNEMSDAELSSPKSLVNIGLFKLSVNDISGIIDLETAISELELQQKLDVSQQLKITLAQAYLNTGEFSKSLQLAETWLNTSERQFDGTLLKAKTYQRMKQYDKASNWYKKALEIEPSNPSLKLSLIEVSPINNPSLAVLALKDVEALLQSHPDFLPAVIYHYMLSKKLNREDTMIAHLLSREEQSPDPTELKKLLAKFYVLEGNYQQAITIFESLKELNKPKPFWKSLGVAYAKMENYQALGQLYNQWFSVAPGSIEAVIGLLNVRQLQGRWADGLRVSTDYLETVNDSNPIIKLMHLELLLRNKLFSQATEFVSNLDAALMTLPFVEGVKGELLFQNANYSSALPKLKTGYGFNPTSINTSLVFTSLLQLKRYEDADDFMEQHLSNHPNDLISILRFADFKIDTDVAKAIALYQRAHQLDEKNALTLNNLAFLLMQQNQLVLAQEYANKALTLNPEDPFVLDTLGNIELKLGQDELALKHLSQAYYLEQRQLPDELLFSYVEALLRNQEIQLAQRKVAQHTKSKSQLKLKLDELINRYK